jgi:hypothetical protein
MPERQKREPRARAIAERILREQEMRPDRHQLAKLTRELSKLLPAGAPVRKVFDDAIDAYVPVISRRLSSLAGKIERLVDFALDTRDDAELVRSRLAGKYFRPETPFSEQPRSVLDWFTQAKTVAAIIKAESKIAGRNFEFLHDQGRTGKCLPFGKFSPRDVLCGDTVPRIVRAIWPDQPFFTTEHMMREGGFGFRVCCIICEELDFEPPETAEQLHGIIRKVQNSLPVKQRLKFGKSGKKSKT